MSRKPQSQLRHIRKHERQIPGDNRNLQKFFGLRRLPMNFYNKHITKFMGH